MRRLGNYGIIVITTLCLTGCATILVGSRQNISIDSEPQTAKVIYQGKEMGQTPINFKVKRRISSPTLKIEVEKEGFQNMIVEIDNIGEPAFAYNIFNLWLFCWIDLISGAVIRYPEYTKTFLTPLIKQTETFDNDLYEKLTKLKLLYDNGILTKGEFEDQKKKLLEKK